MRETPDPGQPDAAAVPADDTPAPGGPRVGNNMMVALITQLLTWGLTFCVTLFLPRYLGDAGLGKLAFATSFSTLCMVAVPLGTSNVLTRNIVRNRSRAGDLLRTGLLLRLLVAFAAILIAIPLVLLWHPSAEIRTLVMLMTLVGAVDSINDLFAAALAGRERIAVLYIANLADRVLVALSTLALVLFRAPLWTFALAGGFSLVGLMLRAYLLRNDFGSLRLFAPFRGWSARYGRVRTLVQEGLPFLGWTVFRAIYGYTDPLVLQVMASQATVGWYALAFRLIGTTLFLPTAILGAVSPTLTRLYTADRPAFLLLAQRITTLLAVLGLPLSLLLILAPGHILWLLHYPAGFVRCIPVIRLAGIASLLYYLASAIGIIVVAANGQRRMMQASLWACVIGPLACILGTYLGERIGKNGASGAMASDVALEVFLIYRYFAALELPAVRDHALLVLRRGSLAILPFALLLLGATAVFPPSGGFRSIAAVATAATIGMIIYAALCLAMRIIDAALLEQLKDKLVARFPMARPVTRAIGGITRGRSHTSKA